MAVTIGVPRETFPGERRVSLVPRACDALGKLGASVVVEQSAGAEAGFPDEQYATRGARPASRREVFQADVILQVRSLGANPEAGRADLALLRPGQTVIGFGEPLTALDQDSALARAGVSFFAMELMPRITRAQSMDALSSMATIAGYRAVLLAATDAAKNIPDADDRRRYRYTRASADSGRGRGRPAGHRHVAAIGRSGLGLRCPQRREGADRKPGRKVCRAGYRHRCERRQRRLRQSHGRGVLSPATRVAHRMSSANRMS